MRLMILILPGFHGRAINFRSLSDVCESLNEAGINFTLMTFSTCLNFFSGVSVLPAQISSGNTVGLFFSKTS